MRDAALFFKTLADESRLQILWLLFHHRELCVCDVMEALGITQSKASRHLSTLARAGLVVGRKEGLWSYFQLLAPEDPLAKRHLQVLRETLGKRPDAVSMLRGLRDRLANPERSCAPTKTGEKAGPRSPRRTMKR